MQTTTSTSTEIPSTSSSVRQKTPSETTLSTTASLTSTTSPIETSQNSTSLPVETTTDQISTEALTTESSNPKSSTRPTTEDTASSSKPSTTSSLFFETSKGDTTLPSTEQSISTSFIQKESTSRVTDATSTILNDKISTATSTKGNTGESSQSNMNDGNHVSTTEMPLSLDPSTKTSAATSNEMSQEFLTTTPTSMIDKTETASNTQSVSTTIEKNEISSATPPPPSIASSESNIQTSTTLLKRSSTVLPKSETTTTDEIAKAKQKTTSVSTEEIKASTELTQNEQLTTTKTESGFGDTTTNLPSSLGTEQASTLEPPTPKPSLTPLDDSPDSPLVYSKVKFELPPPKIYQDPPFWVQIVIHAFCVFYLFFMIMIGAVRIFARPQFGAQ
uniref:Uncharacterized protein n=1 Tax=Panagrolaimus sp. PS1159 TaxID=55785 RepID=A0AC35GN07_9BILA